MNRLAASERYAKAYFQAFDENLRDEKKKEIENFIEYLKKDRVLKRFLVSRAFNKYRKFAVLDELNRNGKLSESFVNFLKIILDNRRSFYLDDILESTVEEADRLEGIKKGICYSAFDLSDDKQKKICRGIEKKIKSKVKLKFIVQANLLGCIRIFIDDQLFDGTLVAMNKALKAQVTEGR